MKHACLLKSVTDENLICDPDNHQKNQTLTFNNY
jgi:hypothetical protein